MANEPMREKWDRYYSEAEAGSVARVVSENRHLLPTTGVGLELACGLAENAFVAAEQGISMEAWDISPVAVERINQRAADTALPVSGQICDLYKEPPQAAHYDLIIVTHFLERDLAAVISAALRPGGLLFYQTFTRSQVGSSGPSNRAFRLAEGELLQLFSELRPVVYREEGRIGTLEAGFRNEALLVAQRAQ